jgi:hypothetical protein
MVRDGYRSNHWVIVFLCSLSLASLFESVCDFAWSRNGFNWVQWASQWPYSAVSHDGFSCDHGRFSEGVVVFSGQPISLTELALRNPDETRS